MLSSAFILFVALVLNCRPTLYGGNLDLLGIEVREVVFIY